MRLIVLCGNWLYSRPIPERQISVVFNLICRYLSNRKIIIKRKQETEITAGVPQAFIMDPILWSVLYDRVLIIEITDAAKPTGFADDLSVIVACPIGMKSLPM